MKNGKAKLGLLIAGFIVLVLGGATLMAIAETAAPNWAPLAWRLIIIGGVALVFFIWGEWRTLRSGSKGPQ